MEGAAVATAVTEYEECAAERSGVDLEDGTCSGFSKMRVLLLYSSFFVKWLVKGAVTATGRIF
jgi:hypothetical protein